MAFLHSFLCAVEYDDTGTRDGIYTVVNVVALTYINSARNSVGNCELVSDLKI